MKKFVIEVLYPEYNNLYGDRGNAEYLKKKLTLAGYDVEIIECNHAPDFDVMQSPLKIGVKQKLYDKLRELNIIKLIQLATNNH